jgi:hypothetical protein
MPPDPATVLHLAANTSTGQSPLPPELQPPDPETYRSPLPPELRAPAPPEEHESWFGRFKDIPHDIVGVFEQGLDEFRKLEHAREERNPPKPGTLTNPLTAARASQGTRAPGDWLPDRLAEFFGLAGARPDVATSPMLGTARSLVARPLGEHYPLEQRTADFEARTPSQRGLAGARNPFSSVPEEHTPQGAAPKQMAPDEKTRLMESFTDLLLPGVGVLPYGRLGAAARPLFTRPPVDPLRTFTTNVSDDLHRIRQAGTADRAEITKAIAGMPAEQRTPEIQRALYNFIERKDPAALTAEDRAVLSDPVQSQHLLGAATQMGWMRQELSNIYNRMRNLGFPDDQLVNPDYMHRRAVGHTPVVDPPLGTGAPDVITGAGRTLPQTTTALQERRFIGGQDINGNRVVVSRDPDSGALQVHEPGGRAPVAVAPHPTNDNEFLYNGRSWALGDTTSNEIERATAGEPHPTTYYHNALANTADALARMRAVERHVDYLDNLTHRPEWQLYATRSAEQARRRSAGRPPREARQQPKIPQLRDGAQRQGWYMHPRVRAVFDDFYRPGAGESQLLDGLRKINQFATASMFWNPVPHIENVLGHWIVGRGFDWIRPSGVRSMFVDGARAIRAVTTQNDDYRRLLREGSGMQFAGVMNKDFYQNVARMAGMDIQRNAARWDWAARMIGNATGQDVGVRDLVKLIYDGPPGRCGGPTTCS